MTHPGCKSDEEREKKGAPDWLVTSDRITAHSKDDDHDGYDFLNIFFKKNHTYGLYDGSEGSGRILGDCRKVRAGWIRMLRGREGAGFMILERR
jgi:hypothetical protein